MAITILNNEIKMLHIVDGVRRNLIPSGALVCVGYNWSPTYTHNNKSMSEIVWRLFLDISVELAAGDTPRARVPKRDQ